MRLEDPTFISDKNCIYAKKNNPRERIKEILGIQEKLEL